MSQLQSNNETRYIRVWLSHLGFFIDPLSGYTGDIPIGCISMNVNIFLYFCIHAIYLRGDLTK